MPALTYGLHYHVNNKAAKRRESKYAAVATTHQFCPIGFEILEPINSVGVVFVGDHRCRTSRLTDDSRESAALFQRLSVAI